MHINNENPVVIEELQSVYNRWYSFAIALLQQEFLFEERRDILHQQELMEQEPCFHFFAILLNNQFSGILATWNLNEFLFIEHFAILPEFRNKGLGSDLLKKVIDETDQPIILEVEPEHDENSRQRIQFYQKLGFEFFSFDYAQPPYHKGYPSLPMKLMYFTKNTLPDFQKVKNELHQMVYNIG